MKAMKKPVLVEFEFAKKDGEIDTIEGKMSYKKGDAIITGVKGERYPCRRDIFDETYSYNNMPASGDHPVVLILSEEEALVLQAAAFLEHLFAIEKERTWDYPLSIVAEAYKAKIYNLYRRIRAARGITETKVTKE